MPCGWGFATARDLLDVRCVTRETAVAVPSGSYSVCIRPSGRIAARRLLVFSAGPSPPSPFLPRGSLEKSSRYFARTSSHTLYTGARKRKNLPSSREQCQRAGTMKCGGGKASHPLLAAPANRRDISVPRDAAHLGETLLTIDHRRIREGKALADVVTTSSNRPSLERYTLAGEVTGERLNGRATVSAAGHLLSEEGKDSGPSALSARQPRSGSAPAHFR
jgi:hypothetical protein